MKPLHSVCKVKEDYISPEDFPDEKFRILTITYDGKCKTEEIRLGKNINFKKMKVVRTGDLVLSDYNTYHGAIGYITPEFNGSLASSSYTVIKCKKNHDTLYLWSILRTAEIRSDILSSAIGMGRMTIDWEEIKNVQIPFLKESERKKVARNILQSWRADMKANTLLNNIKKELDNKFDVESEESIKRFISTKPPK